MEQCRLAAIILVMATTIDMNFVFIFFLATVELGPHA